MFTWAIFSAIEDFRRIAVRPKSRQPRIALISSVLAITLSPIFPDVR
jgi:hypothetical protein